MQETGPEPSRELWQELRQDVMCQNLKLLNGVIKGLHRGYIGIVEKKHGNYYL